MAAIEHLESLRSEAVHQTAVEPQPETDSQQQQPEPVQQQQQQLEQQHEHLHEPQRHLSRFEAVDGQHRPTITELAVQPSSCTSAVHFDMASDGSDGSDSAVDPAANDADDAFWLSEFLSAEADEQHGVGIKRPEPPSDDGGGSGKRHRPG